MEIKINTPYIKLDQLLKYSRIVDNGSDAKALILENMVSLNGQVVVQRGKKIVKGDIIKIKNGETIKVIGE
jgi:ribosome-associated protein